MQNCARSGSARTDDLKYSWVFWLLPRTGEIALLWLLFGWAVSQAMKRDKSITTIQRMTHKLHSLKSPLIRGSVTTEIFNIFCFGTMSTTGK